MNTAGPTRLHLPLKSNKGGDRPELATGTAPETAWEIYNKKAARIDKEMVKDWNDSLTVLLVFAALYSAILSAFIVESMGLLQEDPNETTRDILLTITQQLANTSTPAFEPRKFIVPAYAVRVNIYFFTSIVSSLIAALGAVLALQWIGSYDFGLNSSSAKDRAIQRHFRYMGIDHWKMAEIIAFLPILIFLAVLLSLVGLTEWLFHIHKGISAIIMTALVIFSLFYSVTTVIGAIYVNAPFQTAASKSLSLLFHNVFALKKEFLVLGGFIRDEPTPGHEYSFAKREMRAARDEPMIELKSLLLAVNSIEVLPHQRAAFKVLIEEIMALPTEHLLNPIINSAPWQSIFNMLCEPYSCRGHRDDYQKEEIESGEVPFIAQAVSMIGTGSFDDSLGVGKFLHSLMARARTGYAMDGVSGYALQGGWRHGMPSKSRSPLKFLLYSTLKTLSTSSTGFSKLSLTVVQNEQAQEPDILRVDNGPQEDIGIQCDVNMKEVMASHLIPDVLLDIILQIAFTDLTSQALTDGNPFAAYLYAYKSVGAAKGGKGSSEFAYRSIRRQYIARITQIPNDLQPSVELDNVLGPIKAIMSVSRDSQIETTKDLLTMITKSSFKEKLWTLPQFTGIAVISLVYDQPAITHDDKLGDWITRISIACSEQMQAPYYQADEKSLLMKLFCQTVGRYPHATWAEVNSLQCPPVVLAIAATSGFRLVPPGIDPFPPDAFEDLSWKETAAWAFDHIGETHYLYRFHSGFVQFTQRAMCYGSQTIREKCVEANSKLCTPVWAPPPPIEAFRHQVLREILNIPGTLMWDHRNSILRKISASPWFSSEFCRADGFAWLEREVAEKATAQHYQVYLTIASNAAGSTDAFTYLDEWVRCILDILVRLPPKKCIGFKEDAKRFRTILQDQNKCRLQPRPTTDIPPNSETSIYMHKSRSFEDIQGRTRGVEGIQPERDRYDYVRSWSLQEWNDWRRRLKRLILGLEQGYIIDHEPQYFIDPDGFCARGLREYPRFERRVGAVEAEGGGIVEDDMYSEISDEA